LQRALDESLSLLVSRRKNGFDTQSLLLSAFFADEVLSGAESDALALRLVGMRPTLTRKLNDLVERQELQLEEARRLKENHSDVYVLIGENHMSKYDQRNSQIGAAGDGAKASNFTFGPLISGVTSGDSLAELLSDLDKLRSALASVIVDGKPLVVDGEEVDLGEIGSTIGIVSEAGAAIKSGKEDEAASLLHRAGRWLARFSDCRESPLSPHGPFTRQVSTSRAPPSARPTPPP
jgi:hypothetical protein